jgi:hypothetical protein
MCRLTLGPFFPFFFFFPGFPRQVCQLYSVQEAYGHDTGDVWAKGCL